LRTASRSDGALLPSPSPIAVHVNRWRYHPRAAHQAALTF